MPSLGGATGWLNSEPLGPAELRGHVVLVNFWTLTCINWLRQEPYVRAWSRCVPRRRADRHRSAHAGVLVRARHRPRAAGGEGSGHRLPGRGRQRLRGLERLRQPLLAGALLRRQGRRSSATSTSARGATRNRSASSSACSASSASSSPSKGSASRRRPTGTTWARPRRISATRAASRPRHRTACP